MENATKALLIVAGVLIGVIIISIAVSLYASLNDFVNGTEKQMEINSIIKFNEQYIKYINVDKQKASYKPEEIKFDITLQDIITVAGIANENNINNELTKENTEESSGIDYYVQVDIDNFKHAENRIDEVTNMLNDNSVNSIKYICNKVEISEITGRVYKITFKKIS